MLQQQALNDVHTVRKSELVAPSEWIQTAGFGIY